MHLLPPWGQRPCGVWTVEQSAETWRQPHNDVLQQQEDMSTLLMNNMNELCGSAQTLWTHSCNNYSIDLESDRSSPSMLCFRLINWQEAASHQCGSHLEEQQHLSMYITATFSRSCGGWAQMHKASRFKLTAVDMVPAEATACWRRISVHPFSSAFPLQVMERLEPILPPGQVSGLTSHRQDKDTLWITSNGVWSTLQHEAPCCCGDLAPYK